MKGPAILVVEDDLANQEMTENRLLAAGYQVAIAGTGAEALEALHLHAYDAVLLDIGLPDMTGLVLLMRMRALGFAIPVVVMTAHGGEEMQRQVASTDVAACLTKPVSRQPLLDALAAALA